MRIFRNVTQLETVLKEKSHWAFAMYSYSDKVIGLLYLCPSLSPCTQCVSCSVIKLVLSSDNHTTPLKTTTFEPISVRRDLLATKAKVRYLQRKKDLPTCEQ